MTSNSALLSRKSKNDKFTVFDLFAFIFIFFFHSLLNYLLVIIENLKIFYFYKHLIKWQEDKSRKTYF